MDCPSKKRDIAREPLLYSAKIVNLFIQFLHILA